MVLGSTVHFRAWFILQRVFGFKGLLADCWSLLHVSVDARVVVARALAGGRLIVLVYQGRVPGWYTNVTFQVLGKLSSVRSSTYRRDPHIKYAYWYQRLIFPETDIPSQVGALSLLFMFITMQTRLRPPSTRLFLIMFTTAKYTCARLVACNNRASCRQLCSMLPAIRYGRGKVSCLAERAGGVGVSQRN